MFLWMTGILMDDEFPLQRRDLAHQKRKPVPTAYLPTFCFLLTWKEPYLETVKVWKAATPGGSSLQDVLDGGYLRQEVLTWVLGWLQLFNLLGLLLEHWG